MEAVESFLSDPEDDQQALTVVNANPLQGVSIPFHNGHYRPSVDQMVAAWLHAKFNISNSKNTLERYARFVEIFRGVLHQAGTDLDGDPILIATLMQGWANRPSGCPTSPVRTGTNEVAASTYNFRRAGVNSFYVYACKRKWFASNPIDMVDTRKLTAQDYARPFTRGDVDRCLAQIDRSDLIGKRDFALLSLAFTTGRLRSELAALRWGDFSFNGSRKALVIWRRCKGGKVMEDELQTGTLNAILDLMHAHYGYDLDSLPPDAPIWINYSSAANPPGRALNMSALGGIWLKRLGTGKVHSSRHTFAINMEAVGAKLSDIGARLGHNDLSTTSVYMQRMHQAENPFAAKLEESFGISNTPNQIEQEFTEDGRLLTKSERIEKTIREHPEMSNVQLGRMLGITDAAVQVRRKKLGLNRPRGTNQFSKSNK